MNCELIVTYDTLAYMFNLHKKQLSRQTGSRNLTGPKNASHNIAYLYEACDQISYFCHQQLLRTMRRKISWNGRKDGQTDGTKDRGKTVFPPPWSGGINISVYPFRYTYTPESVIKPCYISSGMYGDLRFPKVHCK